MDSFISPAKIPMKNTHAMPSEMPLILILPRASPKAMISDTMTTVCMDE